MLLSIITVNLNNKEGIKRTFNSVFGQSEKNFEYIVIDGASTDGSVSLIEEYKNKLTYWVSEPDKGIYQAMNKGIAQAKGKYLLFLNSGDTLSQSNVLSATTTTIADSIADIYYTDSYFIDEQKHLGWIKKYPNSLNTTYFVHRSLCHQSMLIKKDLFTLIGNYNEDYQIISDWIFYFEAFKRGFIFKKIDNIILTNFVLSGFSSDYHLNNKERLHFFNKYSPQHTDSYTDIIVRKSLLTRLMTKIGSLVVSSLRLRLKQKKQIYQLYAKSF